jgi:pSer/pThr/pTyr-binding forkhead associated (FHA) protein
MRGEQQVAVDKSPFFIGRRSTKDKIMPDLDLSKDDPKVYISRKHASITVVDGIYFINDLGSANGVRINGKRIPANVAQPLRNRDRIQMGQVDIIFVIS